MAIENPYKWMATFTGFGKVLTKKFLYLLIGGVEICNVIVFPKSVHKVKPYWHT